MTEFQTDPASAERIPGPRELGFSLREVALQKAEAAQEVAFDLGLLADLLPAPGERPRYGGPWEQFVAARQLLDDMRAGEYTHAELLNDMQPIVERLLATAHQEMLDVSQTIAQILERYPKLLHAADNPENCIEAVEFAWQPYDDGRPPRHIPVAALAHWTNGEVSDLSKMTSGLSDDNPDSVPFVVRKVLY